MSLAVIGTDTEIGKTITCAVLLARYATCKRLGYWKPIATGSAQGRDTLVVKGFCGHMVDILEECYLFKPPVSPHLAARQTGQKINPKKVIADLRAHHRADSQRSLVVEGIGGLLVPLTEEGYLLADLIREMDLACLLVTSSRLGTINHTLLTLEALGSRDLKLAGVVLNGPPSRENRRAIEKFGKAEIVGEIEPMDPLSRESILLASRRMDSKGVLDPHFGLGVRP